MKKYYFLIYYWLPPMAWMVMIFYLSSQQRIAIAETYLINFIFFKILHILEYAILYFLFFRALYPISSRSLTLNQKYLLAIAFSLIYAISDEIHQLYVPTREGKPADVIIDSLGILFCFSYTKFNLKSLRFLL